MKLLAYLHLLAIQGLSGNPTSNRLLVEFPALLVGFFSSVVSTSIRVEAGGGGEPWSGRFLQRKAFHKVMVSIVLKIPQKSGDFHACSSQPMSFRSHGDGCLRGKTSLSESRPVRFGSGPLVVY